jgi:hypothetical protein
LLIIPYTEEEENRHSKWLDEFVNDASKNEHDDGRLIMRGSIECFVNRMREEFTKFKQDTTVH